jgi:GTPase SAR1 family protein
VTIVGNKCDLEQSRVVPTETGERLATELGPRVGWMETSAKSDINVTEVFSDIVRKIQHDRARILEEDKIREKKKSRKCTIL